MRDHLYRWELILQDMLAKHRTACPDDTRTVHEICESYMDFLVAQGKVKEKNGKYILPEIRDDA